MLNVGVTQGVRQDSVEVMEIVWMEQWGLIVLRDRIVDLDIVIQAIINAKKMELWVQAVAQIQTVKMLLVKQVYVVVNKQKHEDRNKTKEKL